MRRRKDKKKIITITVTLFMAFLMVTSIAGFIFGGGHGLPTARHKGVKFDSNGFQWNANINGNTYTFSYLPGDVENIEIPEVNFAGFTQIDITSFSNSTSKEQIAEATFELSNVLQTKGVFVRSGFTEENEFALPVITCAQATSFVPVIYYRDANDTQVIQEGNCIIVESASSHGFLSSTNAIAYRVLGLLP